MNNEIENKMTESDATVDRIENTCAERDNIIRGLLFNRTVNVIAVSGREIVETARSSGRAKNTDLPAGASRMTSSRTWTRSSPTTSF